MTSRDAPPTDDEIAAVLRQLADARAPHGSFCPSEAARLLSEDWRPLMGEVRRVAGTMGLVATQRGVLVNPRLARGPIRLRAGRGA